MVRHRIVGLLSGLDMDAQTIAEGNLTDTDWQEMAGTYSRVKDEAGILGQVEVLLRQSVDAFYTGPVDASDSGASPLERVNELLGLDEFGQMRRLAQAIAKGDRGQATLIARKGNPVRLWLRCLDNSGLLEAQMSIKDSSKSCEA